MIWAELVIRLAHVSRWEIGLRCMMSLARSRSSAETAVITPAVAHPSDVIGMADGFSLVNLHFCEIFGVPAL